jgi:hypothetical protein
MKTAHKILDRTSGMDHNLRNAFNELLLSIESANNAAEQSLDSTARKMMNISIIWKQSEANDPLAI